MIKDTHNKSLSIERADWALKVMLIITYSWEVSKGQLCPHNRGHYGSSHIGKSSNDTNVGPKALHLSFDDD